MDHRLRLFAEGANGCGKNPEGLFNPLKEKLCQTQSRSKSKVEDKERVSVTLVSVRGRRRKKQPEFLLQS